MQSSTVSQITDAMLAAGMKRGPVFSKHLKRPASLAIRALARTPRAWGAAPAASLLKVFLPYLNFDTVFDNQRVVAELGETPVPFGAYANQLMQFATDHDFSYPYRPWPGE